MVSISIDEHHSRDRLIYKNSCVLLKDSGVLAFF